MCYLVARYYFVSTSDIYNKKFIINENQMFWEFILLQLRMLDQDDL